MNININIDVHIIINMNIYYLLVIIYYYLLVIIYYLLYIPYWLFPIGHRFVHQSGLYESSGQNSATFRHRNAFHVYLVFSEIGRNTTYTDNQLLSTKTD